MIIKATEDDEFNSASWTQFFGFGSDPKVMQGGILEPMLAVYSPTIKEIAKRCHIEYDAYVQDVETHTVDFVIHTDLFGDIQPGTIAYHVLHMSLTNGGEEVVGFHITHLVSHKQNPVAPLEERIEIIGEPNLTTVTHGLIDYHGEPFSTSAAPSVNLIKQVTEAGPGCQEALDLVVSQPIA